MSDEGNTPTLAEAAPNHEGKAVSSNGKFALPPFLKGLMTREWLFVFLVFVLGFIVRAALMRYELFFEFDSYWHARMVSYILQGLPAPLVDPLGYYQNVQAATLGSVPWLFWYVSAAIYKIFTLNGAYDFETWVLWVKILPALYGAVTCVGMYFLARELFPGKHAQSAGLFAAILAAVIPAFVYRTMGGFYEDDSFGFIWMVFGLFFFIRAAFTEKVLPKRLGWGVASGVTFGIMVLSWPGSNQLVPILIGMGAIGYLSFLAQKEHAAARDYGWVWLSSFIPFAIVSSLQTGAFWLSQLASNLGYRLIGIEFEWWAMLIIFALILGFFWALGHFSRKNETAQRAAGGLYHLALVAMLLFPIFVVLLNFTLTSGGVLGATVGEESQGSNYFGNKYNMLVIFAVLGIPASIFLLWKKPHSFRSLVVPLVWILVTFILAWGKLKFTYYWGLPLALMGGIVLYLGLRWMENKSAGTQKMVAALIGFSLICGIASGIAFMEENTPNIEQSPGWKTALFWANQNLPQDAKFFNWWDEGHWISFLSNRGVLIDNRNADLKAAADAAKFMITSDEAEAASLVEKHGSTHLIFGEDLLTKLTNLGFYAYNITSSQDPRIQGFFGNVLFCSKSETVLTKEVSYTCGENTFTPAQMEQFPTVWNTQPTLLQGGNPLHIYRDAKNTRLYAFTTRANESMLVRLWFDDPTLEAIFPALYANTGGVRIWGFDPSVPVTVPITDDNSS